MKKIKCPKCKSKYNKNKLCSNKNCILSTVPFKEDTFIGWKCLFHRINNFYYNPKYIYKVLKNLLFVRHDLMRTNLQKTTWIDKDYVLLHGMMNLLVNFIENESPYEILVTDPKDISENDVFNNNEQIKKYQELLELYIDWKVKYPQLLELLHKSEIELYLAYLKSDIVSEDYKKHYELKIHITDFEQNMLHKLVDLRKMLWT